MSHLTMDELFLSYFLLTDARSSARARISMHRFFFAILNALSTMPHRQFDSEPARAMHFSIDSQTLNALHTCIS